VWSWDKTTGEQKTKYKGHSDFVKSVVCGAVSGKNVLISGGADRKIIVWDIETGDKLHTLKDASDTMLAIQHLAIDPLSSPEELILVSASSDPHLRFWKITLESAGQILDISSEETTTASARGPVASTTVLAHETSVYRLYFDADEEDAPLYTASADGQAKLLSRPKWKTDEIFEHGDYVRSICTSEAWVITAGRSEDVKLWDRGSGKLHHVYEGHYEEVLGLVVVDGGRSVVSVSIDGTLRVWPLTKPEVEVNRKERQDRLAGNVKEEVKEEKTGLLTAEEEAELAELMDSDDE
jgi:WD40 repeat protein